MTKKLVYFLFFIAIIACSKKDAEPLKSSAKSISSFSFSTFNPVINSSIDSVQRVITVVFPIGTNVSNLIPTIKISDRATISPISGLAQDFTKPVIYTVTAEDGTSQIFTVKASVAKSSVKDIKKFSFSALNPVVNATIDSVNKVIRVIRAILPYGTDLSKLVPTIILSDRANISPNSGIITDFSKSLTYTVTAEDGSSQKYITDFSVPKVAIEDNLSVYIANEGRVRVYNAKDGTLTKTFNSAVANGRYDTQITYNNGITYSKTYDTKLVAIDTKTSSILWSKSYYAFTPDNAIPIVDNNILYLPAYDYLYAFDALTGSEKWRSSVEIPCVGYSVYSNQKFLSSPIIINGIIYISSDVALYAIDSKNGKDKWYFETKSCNSGRFNARPEISNNKLYFGNQNGTMYAIDVNTGKEKWKYATNGAIYSAPKVINGLVLFGSEDSYFYALDSETGKLQWRFLADGSIYSSPVVDNSFVYFSGKNSLYSLNILNGNKNLTFNFSLTTSDALNTRSPVIANGVVYISDADYNLRAVNAYTGATIWKTQTYGSIPVILGNNGTVFVSGESGQK